MKRNWVYLILALAVAASVYWMRMGSDEITDAEPLADVKVPALSGKLKIGEGLFNKNCSSCHGINAAGKNGIAPPLVHIIYEPGHHGDVAFLLAAKNGVRAHHWPFGNMPPVEGVSEQDVAQITAYVRALQRNNGIN